MVTVTKADIGKRVTFKLHACNWNPTKETRMIRDVMADGEIVVVKYNGFDRFLVRSFEVLEVF